MSRSRRTTDYGTVVLHAVILISFVIVTATGLRIGTDDPEGAWVALLDPLLPMEHLWYRHLMSGCVLAATLAGYFVYVRRARLRNRTRFDKARLLVLLKGGPNRWAALNVLMFWVLMGGLAVEIATGVALFAGAGRWILTLHLEATFLCLSAVAAHVALHVAYGGLPQMLRVFRPARLEIAPPPPDLAELLAEQLARQSRTSEPERPAATAAAGTDAEPKPEAALPRPPVAPRPARSMRLNSHPLAVALTFAVIVFGVGIGAEEATRPVLRVVEINPALAPVLDGDISDPVWAKAEPASVLTTVGGDFGGTRQSLVEVRAVHDGTYAYFAFVWEDPTRSLKHMPLLKRGGRWYVVASREDLADETRYNEDKFSVLLTRPGLPLIGGAIHLARQPMDSKPPSSTGRGLHYTDGGIADVWLWRASHGGTMGYIDNCHFGGPRPAGSEPGTQSSYAGGFAIDDGPVAYLSNIETQKAGNAGVLPLRLPRDVAATTRTLGWLREGYGESESEGARWWMSLSETVPYSPALDAAIPDGTVIPSIIMQDHVELRPDSIRGVARWNAGRWTLELARKIYTGSRYDVPIKTGNLMWVAAFDHAEKRHTRHLRPFRLEVD